MRQIIHVKVKYLRLNSVSKHGCNDLSKYFRNTTLWIVYIDKVNKLKSGKTYIYSDEIVLF